LASGFLFQFLDSGHDGGTNRTGAHDLAEGTKRAELRGSVQIGSATMLDLADAGDFVMVVEELDGEKVGLASEQHAHDQGVCPGLVPGFSPPSHAERLTVL
jgi:hypothetical protein